MVKRCTYNLQLTTEYGWRRRKRRPFEKQKAFRENVGAQEAFEFEFDKYEDKEDGDKEEEDDKEGKDDKEEKDDKMKTRMKTKKKTREEKKKKTRKKKKEKKK